MRRATPSAPARRRLQRERMPDVPPEGLDDFYRRYGLNRERLSHAAPDAIVMHPGPINRGVELSSDAADSKQSIILDQVENGVAVRMAVLYLLAAAA